MQEKVGGGFKCLAIDGVAGVAGLGLQGDRELGLQGGKGLVND